MLGAGRTVNACALLGAPLTVTTTFPVVAPAGTRTMMLVALQLLAAAACVPLNVTVLVPCVAPKFVPVMVIEAPTGPEVGLREVVLGPGFVTVNKTPLLASVPVVTTTFPVVAPFGTGTAMLVALQLVGVPVIPLKVTVLKFCTAPKFVPVMVTEVPTGPDVGFRLVMLGVTVKFTALLEKPPTVTTAPAAPAMAALGTGTIMLVPLQLVGVAAAPPNMTVPVPCVVPNPLPVMVTDVPTGPDVGFRLEMLGMTDKSAPLLATPPTVTTTFPVVAPLGTAAVMELVDQRVGVAGAPLNVTVLVPCELLNPSPTMVTDAPIVPDDGFSLDMLGSTVKITPLLATPLTVTTTGPVDAPAPAPVADRTVATMLVALQLVGVAATPPNVTVLVPCVAPKFAPEIVTSVPASPLVGFKLAMLGGGGVTVKPTPLLATPPTVTTTVPVVAPVGTGTVMLVPLQLVGVAATPPNVTVLVPCVAPKFVPVIVTEVPTGPDAGVKL
jgi:hypothetical protein